MSSGYKYYYQKWLKENEKEDNVMSRIVFHSFERPSCLRLMNIYDECYDNDEEILKLRE